MRPRTSHSSRSLPALSFVIGIVVGWSLYRGAEKDPILIPLFRNKFYFDELYAALIAGTQDLAREHLGLLR